MAATYPWKTGVVLAITVAVMYTICAVVYALWPVRGVELLNALFHGLDFRKLETPASSTLATFFFPFAVLVIWAFVAGTLFAWLNSLFDRRMYFARPAQAASLPEPV